MFKKLRTPIRISRGYFYATHLMLLAALAGVVLLLADRRLVLPGWAGAEPAARIVTVAHRGASGYAPECTLSAYRLGVKMNADYIELDLQLTRDGELVVLHDRTVDRTTNGTGLVSELTLAQIKALDAGSWFNEKHPMYARLEYVNEKVPTLREVFETFGKDTRYMLETKEPDDHPGLEEKMWALVEEFDLRSRIAVQSFSKDSLLRIRSWDKDVPLFQLLWYNRPARISQTRLDEIAGYADGIGANFLRIDESYARKVKSSGLLFYPYTVNYQVNMENAAKWGVDGVHTDFPDRFMEVLEEMHDAEA